MSNVPTNLTPTAPSIASAPDPSLPSLRSGFAGVLAFVGLALLGVAAFYFSVPNWFAPALDVADPTWTTYFKHKAVWPVASVTVAFGLLAAAGSYALFTGMNRPDRDTTTWLARTSGFVFLGAALALLAVSVIVFSTHGGFKAAAFTPVNLWAMIGTCLLGVSGVLLILEERPTADKLRQFLLGTGLALGSLTFVLGISLATITFYFDIGKGIGTWQENPWVLLWPIKASLVGLLIAFVSLQPAMPLIRTNQAIRRVVYGTNMVIVTMLLVLILAAINVLAYAQPFNRFFGRSFDWTAKGFHELSPQTRNIVSGLRTPIKVYILTPRGHPVGNDLAAMLDNCKGLNGRLTTVNVEVSARSGDRLSGLMQKYNLTDPQGLLLVAGDDEKGDHVFVKLNDLFEQDMGRGRRGQLSYAFKGEGAFRNALLTLLEGQTKIYFTTGHGEMTAEPPMPGQFGKMQKAGGELNTLRMRLASRESVKVESLTINKNTKEIPKDATLVIVARPTKAFKAEEAAVLRSYLKREAKTRKEKLKDKGDVEKEVVEVTSGKLILLLEPRISEGGTATIEDTGLESLLAEYNVKLGKNRVLTADQQFLAETVIGVAPLSDNAIAKAFRPSPTRATPIQFSNTRTVEAAAPGGKAQIDTIMEANEESGIWISEDVKTTPEGQRQALYRMPRAQARKMLLNDPVSIAVAVSDGGADPAIPRDAAHATARKDTPRMVVFGSSSWITDDALSGRQGSSRINLFTTCAGWLQGSDAIGEPEKGKTREEYTPNLSEQSKDWLYRLPVWFAPLPMLLMVALIVILGAGVWVVRRR